METALEAILTNAGLAGAILVVCGYVLWKKDLQVKELQAAAVTREQELGAKVQALTTEYTGKLTILADARTGDMARVLTEEREGAERAAAVMMSVHTTLTEILGVMAEVRADVRRRAPTHPPERH
jgi:hypothetical protein